MTWLQQILASVLISVIILSRYRSSCFISPMSVSSSPDGLIFKHVAKQEVYLWNKLMYLCVLVPTLPLLLTGIGSLCGLLDLYGWTESGLGFTVSSSVMKRLRGKCRSLHLHPREDADRKPDRSDRQTETDCVWKKRQLKASVTENRWMQLPGGGRGALQPTWGSETKRRHSKERLSKNKEEKRGVEKKKKEGIHEAGTENQAVRWLETQEEMTNCEQMETCHVTVHWAAYGSTRMRTKWGKAQQQAGWLLYLWLFF